MEAVEEKGQAITAEMAREYLKTWGGFWVVKRIAPMATNFHYFKARPLFGEWVRLSVERYADGMNDHNIYQWADDTDYQWIDAIPAQ